MNEPATLNEFLHRAASCDEAGVRFVDRHEQARWFSWRKVDERARGAAGALQGAGIEPGDCVAVLYPTGPEFLDAFFGVLLSGAVPVPLDPPTRLGRLDEYHARTSRMIEGVRARLVLAERRVRVMLGEAVVRSSPPLGCRSLDDLPALALRSVSVSPDDLALVQFSSGTTVEPKPVALTHRSLMTQAKLLNAFWPDGPGIRHSGVSWLPLCHDMGLIGCVLTALERPGVVTLLPPEAFAARPALWLRTISRYRATISPAPNFGFGLAVKKVREEELEGVDLSCWKFALNGAESVVPAVVRSFQARFARWGFSPAAMTPVYGLSEAALAVTFSEVGRGALLRSFDREALSRDGCAVSSGGGIEIASLGRPLQGFRLKIVDAQGHPLPSGRVGAIHVQGPTLMRGYLDRPELTERALPGGWLDTGDLGFVLDGELYVTGRAKDVLLLRGRNHAPEDVEHAATTVKGIRADGAVAASYLPEGADGELLVVLAEAERGLPKTQFAPLAGAAREAVLAATGLAPERVVVLEPGTLPRTSSGKLRRAEALARYLAGELHPPDPVDASRLLQALERSREAYSKPR